MAIALDKRSESMLISIRMNIHGDERESRTDLFGTERLRPGCLVFSLDEASPTFSVQRGFVQAENEAVGMRFEMRPGAVGGGNVPA